LGEKINARQAALREFIPAGKGHAVLSGAKFVEVDHPARPDTVCGFQFSIKMTYNINKLSTRLLACKRKFGPKEAGGRQAQSGVSPL
jgi:hypothetical protein